MRWYLFAFHRRATHRVGVQLRTAQISGAGLLSAAVLTTGAEPPIWLKTVGVMAVSIAATLSVDDRLAADWLRAAWAHVPFCRRSKRLAVRSAAVTGSISDPGELVGVRWDGDDLVAVVALAPRPLTPTIVGERTLHADVCDTAVIAEFLAGVEPGIVVDVVSAGWRVSPQCPPAVRGSYEQLQGSDPAPGFRRTWLVLRADPYQVVPHVRWRGAGVGALAQTLVATATRLADTLASSGIDARAQTSFAVFDELTGLTSDITAVRWSHLRRPGCFTTVFCAPGGPDVWWSIRADRTLTRTRLRCGQPPRSVVALTTSRPIDRDPPGWSRLRGAQAAALAGATPIIDRHWRVPIGSAGVLVGKTADDGLNV